MSARSFAVKIVGFWLVKLFKISLAILIFGNVFYLGFVFLNGQFFRKTLLPSFYFVVSPKSLTERFYSGFILSLETQGPRTKVELADYEGNRSQTFTFDNNLPVKDPPSATASAVVNDQTATPATAGDLKLGDQIKLIYVAAPPGQKVLALDRLAPSTGVAVIYGKIAQLKDTSFSLNSLSRTYEVRIKGKIKLGPKYKIASVSAQTISLPGEVREVADFKSLKTDQFVNVFYSRTENNSVVADQVVILN